MNTVKPKGIGILGGTFDPIHLGHTEPAKVVAKYLDLDKILFIPASIPYHKSSPDLSAEQRAEMVSIACDEVDIFQCDTRELERSGNTYTIDTIKSLKQSYPEQTLFFIIGVDSLVTFTQWHQYQDILSFCHLVVNVRPNYQLTQLDNYTVSLIEKHKISDLSRLNTQHSGGIIFVPTTQEKTQHNAKHQLPDDYIEKTNLDISSTDIRTRLANKKSCQHLLNSQVLEFINKNALYR